MQGQKRLPWKKLSKLMNRGRVHSELNSYVANDLIKFSHENQ